MEQARITSGVRGPIVDPGGLWALSREGSFKVLLDLGAAGLQDKAEKHPGILANLNATLPMWRASSFIPCGAPASVADEPRFTTGTSMQAITAIEFPGTRTSDRHEICSRRAVEEGPHVFSYFPGLPRGFTFTEMDSTNATGLVIVTDVDEVRKGLAGAMVRV